MSESRKQLFTDRALQFGQQEKKASGKSSTVSWLRLGVFMAGVAVAYHFFNSGQNAYGILSILGFYILFTVVLRWHARLDFKYKQLQLTRKLNEEENARLQGKLTAFDGGDDFINAQHAYTSDLDIFGQNSLFQLVNRSVTSIGKYKLAGWLQQAAPAIEIKQRQEAVAELATESKLDWLQYFLALPRHYKHTLKPADTFINWFRNHSFYPKYGWLKVLLFILPVLTIGAIILWAYGFSGYIPTAFILVQFILAYRFAVQRDEYYENSISIYEAMRSYTLQLKQIEHHTFTSPRLQQLQADLHQHQRIKASVAINKLANIIDFFSWRLSTLMAFFLNSILMWDFYWIYRLETWKAKHLEQVESALVVLAEFEALASIAAFQHAHPQYAIPELSEQPFEFRAQQLAHPLIFSVSAVANDFEMQGAGKTMVVTGSNMSGKTTFLRTIGINMVLAFTGAPACATRLKVAPAQVYTAMRTVDNLAENTSSFYAELKRLRMLLELTELGQPVFYLLDEILKGTNSRDRHLGAMTLIRQLHQRHTSGLISTHDLELGAMEEELPDSVKNYSFNSTITGNEINFDYKLTPGICRSFNASKLMQLMGIAIEEQV
ncbi:MutS-related protein [Pontibacter arcticus]|uniref:DNA mismatch repair protein MutS n=1 Tax=Pontibacter arcticus TaxID=2080288 RepID=A0A364RHL3_9BACT|nr:DNA mismatch repair protein MutS [Pontibacter arcticus]RAU83820.1 DNA mismatch repair protein MutS [Pontibacter arcticus]